MTMLLCILSLTANAQLEIEMIYVKGGTFTMGSYDGLDVKPEEKPAHKVTVSDFYMSKYLITQSLYQDVMGTNPSEFVRNNAPVENVSWDECQVFIAKLNQITGKKYRLPTEAEWEYVARQGGENEYWMRNNSRNITHRVGCKRPNKLGIYDLKGNVWEWCQDFFGYYSDEVQVNPKGPQTGDFRICRGGAWDSSETECTATYRNYLPSSRKRNNIGFRLVIEK